MEVVPNEVDDAVLPTSAISEEEISLAPAATRPTPAESRSADDALSEATVLASQPFIGRWNKLVSTTNWEKGRIICQWRTTLVDEQAPVSDFSDEAWARLVGGVTGQHVGRLRRVYQRFADSHEQFPQLFWSHFQAAIDWTDAEMWLEGAVQNGWSISGMRNQRWETLGKLEADRPQPIDVVTAETDEDFEPNRNATPNTLTGDYADVQGPRREGPDFGDNESSDFSPSSNRESYNDNDQRPTGPAPELIQPFADLAQLPEDLADAFDLLKLAILRHKSEKWSQIGSSDLLRTLDALKTLVLAPSDDTPPF